MLYSEEFGTLTADDGTQFETVIQHVDIDPHLAKTVFARGIEVGDWGWKHKIWFCDNEIDLAVVRAAARFYYGWDDNSERVTQRGNGLQFEAWYAC